MPRTDLEEGRGKPNNLHGNKKANAGKVTGLRVHGQPTIRATHQQPNMCSPKAVEKANAKCLKQNWQWESHPMMRQPLNLERRTAQNTCKKCNWPVWHTAREYPTRQTQNWYIQNIPSIMYRNGHAIARTGKGCSKNYTHHTQTLPHETPKIRNHETLQWSHCTKTQNSTDIPSQ